MFMVDIGYIYIKVIDFNVGNHSVMRIFVYVNHLYRIFKWNFP